MSQPHVSDVPPRGEGRRWHPALAVPVVIAATAVLPPLGAVLAFWARWGKPARAVTVTLACVWFIVLVAADPGAQKPRDDAKAAPQPTVTAATTATATVTVTLTPAPAPATASPSSAAASTPAPAVLSPSQDAAKTTGPRQAPPALGGPESGSGSGGRADDGDGSSSAVSYRNCTDVRAADADPIRRGDPGYGRHLDRDGDGVACE